MVFDTTQDAETWRKARRRAKGVMMGIAPHEGPGAASSRTAPLDAVVGGHGQGEDECQ